MTTTGDDNINSYVAPTGKSCVHYVLYYGLRETKELEADIPGVIKQAPPSPEMYCRSVVLRDSELETQLEYTAI